MKDRTVVILLIVVLTFLSGCDEFFVEDLSDSKVVLVAPSDCVKTTNFIHLFKWEAVEGADWYNLRVVSPDFQSTEQIVLDTNLTQESYSYELPSGEYQWGVQAVNYSGASEYSIRTLVVDTNTLFAKKYIELLAPQNMYTNLSEIEFRWESIEGADKYRFEVRVDSWSSGNVFSAKDIDSDRHTVELSENIYYWGVQGYNSESNTSTDFFFKQIFVDLTSPGRPNLVSPEDDYITTESLITLKWERGSDTGSPLYDSLYLATDKEFVNIVLNTSTADTLYEIQPEAGEYYWMVKSFDKAGNAGANSLYRKFTVSQ